VAGFACPHGIARFEGGAAPVDANSSEDEAVPAEGVQAESDVKLPWPTITLEQMSGFSLFMLKAVLNGRGNEIIDLARINLFR
jgi:hypothetical protein